MSGIYCNLHCIKRIKSPCFAYVWGSLRLAPIISTYLSMYVLVCASMAPSVYCIDLLPLPPLPRKCVFPWSHFACDRQKGDSFPVHTALECHVLLRFQLYQWPYKGFPHALLSYNYACSLCVQACLRLCTVYTGN